MIIEYPFWHRKNSIADKISTKTKFRCGSCGQVIGAENASEGSEHKNNEDNFDSENYRNKEIIFKKTELWKKHLLDLTSRNRLRHFKAGRTSTVKITAPSIEEVSNCLVIKGNSLSFALPKREHQLILEETVPTSLETIKQGD